MNVNWKGISLNIAVTLISVSLIFLMPERIIENAMLSLLIGVMIAAVMGEKPEFTGPLVKLNKALYWFLPVPILILILILFSIYAALFYIIGVVGVITFKRALKKRT